MTGLYDSDILIWSEQQAALLRRVAAGERSNDLVDWANVIEEVESVGCGPLHQVESLLVQARVQMLKASGWPEAREAPHWRAEARRFRADAAARLVPSMGHRIEPTRLYRRSLAAVPESIDGESPLQLPDRSPMTLEELLSEA